MVEGTRSILAVEFNVGILLYKINVVSFGTFIPRLVARCCCIRGYKILAGLCGLFALARRPLIVPSLYVLYSGFSEVNIEEALEKSPATFR